MTSEQNKAIVRRFYKAFEDEDLQALKDVLAPELVAYNPNAQNRDQHIQGIFDWHAAFSENHFEIHEQIAEGDTIVTRVTLRCLHTKAPFAGILPSGKPFEAPAVTIERVKDGKIVERMVISETQRNIARLVNEQNKALVRRFIEESGNQDQTAYKEMIAPDFVAHLAVGPQNRQAFLLHSSAFPMAFSDIQITVKEQTAEGDMVMTHTTWRGTHTGDFRGLPPTGKQIAISAFLSEQVQDGKVVEHWSLFDQMSMMQQLGVIPSPQTAR